MYKRCVLFFGELIFYRAHDSKAIRERIPLGERELSEVDRKCRVSPGTAD